MQNENSMLLDAHAHVPVQVHTQSFWCIIVKNHNVKWWLQHRFMGNMFFGIHWVLGAFVWVMLKLFSSLTISLSICYIVMVPKQVKWFCLNVAW